MCGCSASSQSRASNRSFVPMHERNANRAVEICKQPIEYYLGLNTSKWEPNHQAIVRSQINVYHRKCDQFYDTIEALQEFYRESIRD